MTKRLIDIDDAALAAARVALGTTTMRDTVNQALRHVSEAADRQLAASLAALGAVEFVDRSEAWR